VVPLQVIKHAKLPERLEFTLEYFAFDAFDVACDFGRHRHICQTIVQIVVSLVLHLEFALLQLLWGHILNLIVRSHCFLPIVHCFFSRTWVQFERSSALRVQCERHLGVFGFALLD